MATISEPAPDPADRIVIGPEQIEQLVTRFEAVWRHPPTNEERRALIEDLVREEIYYREALALGLDRDDTVIRRRMRQKMEFLTDTAADLLEPAAGELEAYLEANGQTYRNEPQLSFEQIYLGKEPDPDSVGRSISALRSDPETDPTKLGQSSLIPVRFALSPPRVIDGAFGQGFFERAAELPPGSWAGPVKSSYGVHIVRVRDSLPARMPPLEEVRAAVLRDWKVAKAKEIREAHYGQLRERYVVEIPDDDTQKTQNK